MSEATPVPFETANLIDRSIALNARYDAAAGTEPPGTGFNARRVCFYTGMQLEEMREKLQAIQKATDNPRASTALGMLLVGLHAFAKEFKAGVHVDAVERADRQELLDGDIDLMVVSAGSMGYQTPHYRGAVAAVLDANDEKTNPVALVDKDGKWLKPNGWVKPDLSIFVVPSP